MPVALAAITWGLSIGLGKILYNLSFRYISYYFSPQFIPLKFVKIVTEWNDSKREEIYFNENKKQVNFKNKKNDLEIFFSNDEKLFDLISGIQFFRLNMNSIYKNSSSFHLSYIHNRNGKKNLNIELLGNDYIKISRRYFRAKKFYCVLESSNKLVPEKTEVYFWISDDKNKLPLYLETKIRFSKIKIELNKRTDQLF